MSPSCHLSTTPSGRSPRVITRSSASSSLDTAVPAVYNHRLHPGVPYATPVMRDRPPPPSLEPPSVYTFLKTVLRSGLLNQEELRGALDSLPPENTGAADAVAEHLIKIGRLSRFQARKLLQGTFRGLLLGPY